MSVMPVSNKFMAFALGVAVTLAVAYTRCLAQTAPSSSELQLEQKGEQLEQQLSSERQKLQDMETQLRELRSQMQAFHGQSPTTQAAPIAAEPITTPAKQTTRNTVQRPSNAASVSNSTTSVQASSSSRRTPGRSAAVQAAYQQQHALFRPGLTFYPQFQYAYTNSQALVLNGFLAFGAIFLGNVNVSSTETDLFEWNPQLYYAFNRHFELNVGVPYIYERSTFKEVGANFTTGQQSRVTVNKWGLGDASGGFYWQVMDQHGWWPNIIWNAQASAPTGTSPYGIKLLTDPSNGNLKYPNNLPTGKGVWGISSGFSLIRELDPVVLFGSGNYYYEFTQHAGDVSTVLGKTTPGEVAPGNSMSYTLGATVALNERFSTLVELQDIITNTTEVKPEGGGWTAIPSSSGNAAQFIFGATYAAGHNFFPFLQAGIGATQYAPNFQISLWAPYYF